MKIIEEPSQYPVVVHGTYMEAWSGIKGKGLLRMTRNYIHFAPGLFGEDEVKSGNFCIFFLMAQGMRKNCEVAIYVDIAKAIAG